MMRIRGEAAAMDRFREFEFQLRWSRRFRYIFARSFLVGVLVLLLCVAVAYLFVRSV
jgi:hypothetical protein